MGKNTKIFLLSLIALPLFLMWCFKAAVWYVSLSFVICALKAGRKTFVQVWAQYKRNNSDG